MDFGLDILKTQKKYDIVKCNVMLCRKNYDKVKKMKGEAGKNAERTR